MKKQLLTYILTLSVISFSTAQIITFDDQGHVDNGIYGNPYIITNNGETFIFTVSGVTGGPTTHRYRTTDSFGCGNTGFNHLSSGNFAATTWTIETQSGNEIDLGTIRFDNLFQCYSNFSFVLTIEGFKNNNSIGSQTFTVVGVNSIFNSNSNFDDVDRIVISCADLGNLGIDDINWTSSTLSINDFSAENKTKLFPNPSSDFIKIYGLDEMESYKLFNVMGKEINQGSIPENGKIDIRNIANGFYLLKFDNGRTIKFIKK